MTRSPSDEKADPRLVALVVVVIGALFSPIFLNGFVAAAAILGTTAVFAVGVVLGQRLMRRVRWTRPVKLLPAAVPQDWPERVRTGFPLSRTLDDESFERLLKLIQVFVKEKRFEGAGGLEITDEMKVTIAAQACLLILRQEIGLYPALKTIIVYPGTVVPRRPVPLPAHGVLQVETEPRPIVGQSWRQGIVVLSWDSARHGAFDPRDGDNVVLHEFAHQLDQETGEADGIPAGIRLSSLRPWAEMLARQFQSLAKASRRGEKTVMSAYGATNHAEFFAVATETFFEKPRQLHAKRPDVYALLSEVYRIDPINELTVARSSGAAPDVRARGRAR